MWCIINIGFRVYFKTFVSFKFVFVNFSFVLKKTRMRKRQSGFSSFSNSLKFVIGQTISTFVHSVEFVSPEKSPHIVKIYFVFMQPISNNVHSNSSNSIRLAHASGRIWMNIEMRRNWMDKDNIWLAIDNFEWKITKFTLTLLHSSLLRTLLNLTRPSQIEKVWKLTGKPIINERCQLDAFKA